jgi:4-hydroxy-tetrahydrodipicolinate reductase
MKLAIYGASGRMGRTVAQLALAAPDTNIVGAVDSAGSEHLGRDVGSLAGHDEAGVVVSADLASALLGCDVLIDFSVATAFDAMIRTAARQGVAVVSGTTRLSEASLTNLNRAAEKIPVLWAPNMSLGVQLLAQLVRQAVGALCGPMGGYDVEVVEAHHNRKLDAPSGTATYLVEAAQQALPELEAVHGREGMVGTRKPTEIGVHALRGGGIVGDHSVHLIGEYDRIEINHRAMSRELFAAGALRAAHWLVGQSAGRYQLADVLANTSGN